MCNLPLLCVCISTLVRAVSAAFSQIRSTEARLSNVIDRFRAEEMPERHSTRTAYESMLTKWIEPRWGQMPLTAIKTLDIEAWLREMPGAPKTRQHRKALLHLLFECAIRWELAGRNPVAQARIKGGIRRRRRPSLITLSELKQILERLREPYRQMVLLCALLGLRASEVVALKWTDFDFDNLTVRIGRGSVSRRIAETKTESSEDLLPLHEEASQEILRFAASAPKSDDLWVFPSPVTGGPYHQDSIRKRHLIPAGESIGLSRPLGWHTFRHSYRRWLDEAGTPVGIIKELMRHADVQTTMNIYGVGTLTPAKRQAGKELARTVLKAAG